MLAIPSGNASYRCDAQCRTNQTLQLTSMKHRFSFEANTMFKCLRNCPHFTKPEVLLLCSQEPTTSPCPVLDEANPHLQILASKDPF
jgi:hypothetical protein